MKDKKIRIVLIGSGNVATHLGLALQSKGYSIVQVYSRTKQSAQQLSQKLSTSYTTQLNELVNEADLYILAVKDDAINELTKVMKIKSGLVVHTSGSINVEVLKKHFLDYGVFYPLQTFSKTRKIDFASIPIFVEASTKKNVKLLKEVASSISQKVYIANSEKRKYIHLSAVFASNFTNHMYAIAEKILKQHKVPLSILYPLIEETAAKVQYDSPAKLQTGPAIRRDKKVLKLHQHLLRNQPGIKEVYKSITRHIVRIK